MFREKNSCLIGLLGSWYQRETGDNQHAYAYPRKLPSGEQPTEDAPLVLRLMADGTEDIAGKKRGNYRGLGFAQQTPEFIRLFGAHD